MIFLTVGSALPFDRLVKLVDEANKRGLFEHTIFAQIGAGNYQPTSFEFTDFLDNEAYSGVVDESVALISHAGIGSINASLQSGKPMLVMPRRKSYGELVDDHQAQTADIFSRLGHILAFETAEQLEQGLRKLPDFKPKSREPNRLGIAEEIQRYIQSLVRKNTALAKEI